MFEHEIKKKNVVATYAVTFHLYRKLSLKKVDN